MKPMLVIFLTEKAEEKERNELTETLRLLYQAKVYYADNNSYLLVVFDDIYTCEYVASVISGNSDALKVE